MSFSSTTPYGLHNHILKGDVFCSVSDDRKIIDCIKKELSSQLISMFFMIFKEALP